MLHIFVFVHLFRLIQQEEILGNTLLCELVPTARRFWMINYGQN